MKEVFMDSDSNNCRSILLPDTPAQEDAFGSHERVATAIAYLINSEEGGKTIGLEGGWGSGKSTIINLMRKNLSNSPDILTVLFDAWAHQGDPLRRTFLETLINGFQTKEQKWVNEIKWDRKKDELANRRKIEEKKTFPQIRKWGKLLIIFSLLVPLGLVFLSAGVNKGIYFSIDGSLNWEFLLGFLLSTAPLWLLIYLNYIQRNKTGSQSDDLFALLFQKTITDIRTETIESPEPTSLEFETLFVELMQEALNASNRKVVIVLDNLDRVDAQEALSILSTLQTFIEHKADCDLNWLSRVWIIIPYDPRGLIKLLQSNESHQSEQMASPYMDKRFQIRFDAPPLLLSNWSEYLYNLLKVAFPEHDTSEFHPTYRVFTACRDDPARPTTPRELKLFVNQIGVIHRQWGDAFPLHHIGYYVRLRQQGTNIVDFLLKSKHRNTPLLALLGDGLEGSLAAMYFNVEIPLARQLLLRDPIEVALGDGNDSVLLNLSKQTGFWQVFEDIPLDDWAKSEPYRLSNAALATSKCHILNDADKDVKRIITASFKSALNYVSAWKPFDEHVASGISALLLLINANDDLILRTIQVISASLESASSTEKTISHDALISWVNGLVEFLKTIEVSLTSIEVVRSWNIKITLSPEAYIELYACLYEQDPDGNYWDIIQPIVTFENIDAEIGNIVKSDNVSERHVGAIKVLKANRLKGDWAVSISEIGNRLRTTSHFSPQIVGTLLTILWELREADQRAVALIKELSQQGYIFHHLHRAHNDNKSGALCILSYMSSFPDMRSVNQVGDSETGRSWMNQLITAPEEFVEINNQFANLLSEYQEQKLLYKILDSDAKAQKWIWALLKIAAISDDVPSFFPPDVVMHRWSDLELALGSEDFDKVIGELLVKTNLVDSVLQNELDVEQAGLYSSMIRSGCVNNTQFQAECTQILQNIELTHWQTELAKEGKIVELVVDLVDAGVEFTLDSTYQDALVNHANQAMDGNVKVKYLAGYWDDLFRPLKSFSRESLRDRILDNAKQRDGNISQEFFALYGNEIGDIKALEKDSDVFLHLFIPIVRNRHVSGLKWLAEVLEKHPKLLTKKLFKSDVQDFQDRIKKAVASDIQDDATEYISMIDRMFPSTPVAATTIRRSRKTKNQE
jgi:hypothetical protein